ncbi:hypothetical protein L208DRAFT_1244798 [Tricholoma matsutake]|nr:hypothetical protein L208DRAFT_1244798 [Tricholoma matsutake 945]
MIGWVNSNLYQPTTEIASVLPIPSKVRSTLGMGSYESSLHSKQHHHFLASMQKTRKPVLPVHNSQERNLFRDFMTGNSRFNDPISGPNWEQAIRLWNNTADITDGILYKLTEQLKVYYDGDWKRNTNIKQTKSMTADVHIPLKQSLRPTLLPAPPISRSPPITTLPSLSPAPPAPMPSSSSAPHPETPAFHVACKQALAALLERPTKKWKGCTCQKCAFEDCPGKKSVNLCKNTCQYCSQQVCQGWNPQCPMKPCHAGWDD